MSKLSVGDIVIIKNITYMVINLPEHRNMIGLGNMFNGMKLYKNLRFKDTDFLYSFIKDLPVGVTIMDSSEFLTKLIKKRLTGEGEINNEEYSKS